MRKILILTISIICFMHIHAGDNIFTNNNGVITTKPTYINQMCYIGERNHDIENYIHVFDTVLSTRDGHVYELKAYQHKEDYIDKGDSTFSRIDITCKTQEIDDDGNILRDQNGNVIYYELEPVSFTNDDVWTHYNCWGFAIFTDHPWKDPQRIMCKKIDIADNCCAILLRGWQYSTNLRELSIILLYEDQAVLVYNQERDVVDVKDENGITTLSLQDNWFRDDEEIFIPHIRRLVFGNGTITEEK